MAGISDTPRSGTGLLAIFCDLDADDQQDFRPWLAEDMFPARMQIGFNACASYDRVAGEGQQFLTLYEMPSLGHLYGEAYQGLRRHRKPRDAAYHGKFRNPERYTLAWTGPEFFSGVEADAIPGPFIRVDRFNLDPAAVQDFNIQLVTRNLPALAQSANIVRFRRYLSMEGSPSHFLLREYAVGAEFPDPFWQDLGEAVRELRSALYRRVIANR